MRDRRQQRANDEIKQRLAVTKDRARTMSVRCEGSTFRSSLKTSSGCGANSFDPYDHSTQSGSAL